MATLAERLKEATKNASAGKPIPEVKISSAAALSANSDSGVID